MCKVYNKKGNTYTGIHERMRCSWGAGRIYSVLLKKKGRTNGRCILCWQESNMRSTGSSLRAISLYEIPFLSKNVTSSWLDLRSLSDRIAYRFKILTCNQLIFIRPARIFTWFIRTVEFCRTQCLNSYVVVHNYLIFKIFLFNSWYDIVPMETHSH